MQCGAQKAVYSFAMGAGVQVGCMADMHGTRMQDASHSALKNTVEQLESRLVNVEVQYAGRLQAQKAKADHQSSLIAALMERVAALEARCP